MQKEYMRQETCHKKIGGMLQSCSIPHAVRYGKRKQNNLVMLPKDQGKSRQTAD